MMGIIVTIENWDEVEERWQEEEVREAHYSEGGSVAVHTDIESYSIDGKTFREIELNNPILPIKLLIAIAQRKARR